MRILCFMLAVTLLFSGCSLGPNYQRPSIDLPDQYRQAQGPSSRPDSFSLADEKWWQVFKDPALKALIQTALRQNFDLRIAADHIIEAQAQLNITSSYQYPTVTAAASPMDERVEKVNSASPYHWGPLALTGSVSWDLDFWGKYRRMIEAAKANFLSNQWAQREVITTLIAEVAGAYFQLRELDIEMEISKRTLLSRQGSLKLTQQLADHGSASMLDVSQAEQLVYTASENIPDLERRIAQQENLISVLVGENPAGVTRGWRLTQNSQLLAPYVPAGLPSSLLERRPDIREAEEQLVSLNAQIGVAQGAYFPDISLTGTAGYESVALSKLFTGPSGLWDIVGTVTQPIFTAGRLKAGVKLARAQQQEALHVYRKTIQEAFREVSDALIAYQRTREFTVQQALLTKAAQEATRLSNLRYKGGSASYLEVLDSETTSYSAQLSLAQAHLSELQALIDLYKSLGGGWN